MTSWQLISHSGNRHNSSKRAKNSYSNYCRNISLKALGDSIARSFTSDSVCDGLHNTVSSSFHCPASNRLSSSCQCSESVPWGTFQIVCGFWKWQLVVTTEISILPSLSVFSSADSDYRSTAWKTLTCGWSTSQVSGCTQSSASRNPRSHPPMWPETKSCEYFRVFFWWNLSRQFSHCEKLQEDSRVRCELVTPANSDGTENCGRLHSPRITVSQECLNGSLTAIQGGKSGSSLVIVLPPGHS